MRSAPPYLEIHVHGVDGYVSAFVQRDAETNRKLLDQIQPGRIFAQPYLAFSGRHSLTVFPSAAVVRIDLVLEEFPDWPFHFGVADAMELSEEEFPQRLPRTAPDPEPPGALDVAFAEFELTNGERIFLEVHLQRESRTPVDVGLLLQHILSAPSLHARRLGGGAIVINPAQILRLSLYPGPPETPPNAWPAQPLGG